MKSSKEFNRLHKEENLEESLSKQEANYLTIFDKRAFGEIPDSVYETLITKNNEGVESLKQELNVIRIEENNLNLLDKKVNEFILNMTNDKLLEIDKNIIRLCIIKVMI